MSKNPIFKLSAIALTITSLAPLAVKADDLLRNEHSEGSIGLGGEVTSNSVSGTAGGMQARMTGRLAGYDDPRSQHTTAPYFAVEADLTYNMVGGTSDGKLTTGIGGRFRGFAGGSLLEVNEPGCDIYAGVAGQIDGGLYLNRAGQTHVIGNVGPETGLMCQTNDIVLQLSPSVGLGGAYVASEKAGTDKNMVQMGGRARVIVKDRLMVSADAFATPQIGDNNWTAKYGSVNAQVNAGKWTFTGYSKGLKLEDTTGLQKSVRTVEVGAIAGRAF